MTARVLERGGEAGSPTHRHAVVGSRQCGRSENQCDSFLTKLHLPCDPAVPPLGVCPTEMKTMLAQKPACDRLHLTVVRLKLVVLHSEQ